MRTMNCKKLLLNDHIMNKKEDTDVIKTFYFKTLSKIVTKIHVYVEQTHCLYVPLMNVNYFKRYLIMFSFEIHVFHF